MSTPHEIKPDEYLRDEQSLCACVEEVVQNTPVFDMHTHLYAPQFGELNLWGIDELVTYHYLIAELFRACEISVEAFWKMEKQQQADLIWQKLFVENPPVSEACCGVVAVMSALGLNPRARTLKEAREYFEDKKPYDYLSTVLQIAGVSDVAMTNDPLNEIEEAVFDSGEVVDSRFHAVLRIDPILNDWANTHAKLAAKGFKVTAKVDAEAVKEVRRFFDHWIQKMRPLYLAVSLENGFAYPEQSSRQKLIDEVVVPTCREHDIPFAMMIGVRRQINPALRVAGDGVGPADVSAVVNLCLKNPDNRFLVTMLSRENQHELCVAARKFRNLLPFGCWWFLNNPSIIQEMTRERIEMLGTTFVPQHSDARILDQLIYKWRHSRRIISQALAESYARLLGDGRVTTRREVEQDVARLLSGNIRTWTCLDAIQAPLSYEVKRSMSQAGEGR
jgi:hypothetical protein